jgi:hypothetical protein
MVVVWFESAVRASVATYPGINTVTSPSAKTASSVARHQLRASSGLQAPRDGVVDADLAEHVAQVSIKSHRQPGLDVCEVEQAQAVRGEGQLAHVKTLPARWRREPLLERGEPAPQLAAAR